MTGELPDWADELDGFNRELWWVPVACVGSVGLRHQMAIVGLMYEISREVVAFDGPCVRHELMEKSWGELSGTVALHHPMPAPLSDGDPFDNLVESLRGSVNVVCDAEGCSRKTRIRGAELLVRIVNERAAGRAIVGVSALD